MTDHETFDEGYDAYWEGVDVQGQSLPGRSRRRQATVLGRRLAESPAARLRRKRGVDSCLDPKGHCCRGVRLMVLQ